MFRSRRRHRRPILPVAYDIPSSPENVGSSNKTDLSTRLHLYKKSKHATLYTNLTGLWFFVSLMIMLRSWWNLSSHNALTYLHCKPNKKCHLKLKNASISSSPKKTTSVQFQKHQIIGSEYVRVTKDGTVIQQLSGRIDLRQFQNTEVPEKDLYDSYTLILRDSRDYPLRSLNGMDGVSDVDFRPGRGTFTRYTVAIRRHSGLRSRRGSARYPHSQLLEYIHGRRKMVYIVEIDGHRWKFIAWFFIGFVSFMLCVLFGDFGDEEEERKGRQRLLAELRHRK